MIPVTISGQACWLVTHAPNSDDKVRLLPKIAVDAVRGLTGPQSRRPQAQALRFGMEWTSLMLPDEYAALRNATQSGQDEPIVAPLWPFAITLATDSQPLTAGLTIAWTEDFATYAINPGSYAAYTYAAPLVFGRFTQVPRLAGRSPSVVRVDFSFDEDAPVSYAVTAGAGVLTDTTYATISGYAATIFPFLPDWSKAPSPPVASLVVERSATGPGRQKSTTYYPQTPEQIYSATIALETISDAAKLIAWWQRRAGGAEPHWIPSSQPVGQLAADVAVGTTVLAFDSTIAPIGNNSSVALFEPGGTMEFHRVASTSASSITLTTGLAKAWRAYWTSVAPAFLAVHTDDRLSIDFTRSGSGWLGRATLHWREVAPEYVPPAGETRGTTLGKLPPPAWFFQIDLDYNGGIATTYLTNWESGAVANGHTWQYNACDFDKLVRSLDLADDECTFNVRWFSGCPWENWLPGQLAARGFLTIYRADVQSDGSFANFALFSTGELSVPVPDGPDLAVKVLGANARFGLKGPQQLMSLMCGTRLFRPRCGLLLSDWTFNGVVTAVSGNVVTIGTLTRANGAGLPSGFAAADWFALGWLQWTIAGMPRRGGVLTSTAISGGTVALTLDVPAGVTVGQSISVAPGCDRLGTTCDTKFNNAGNNRGFPLMPAVAPGFVIPQKLTPAAKK